MADSSHSSRSATEALLSIELQPLHATFTSLLDHEASKSRVVLAMAVSVAGPAAANTKKPKKITPEQIRGLILSSSRAPRRVIVG